MVKLLFITALLYMCVMPEIAGLTEYPQEIGCFSTDFVKRHEEYYRLKYLLPKQYSHAACDHRQTVYMGLQAQQSYPEYHVVFCGNDIEEHSRPVDKSLCNLCVNYTTLFCGGKDTMSLYKLREYSPLAVLVTFNNAIWLVVDDKEAWGATYRSRVKDVDFLFTDDDLFTVSNNNLRRDFYALHSNNYRWGGSVTITSDERITDIAVDWLNKSVFWFNMDSKEIKMAYLFNDTTETVLHRSSDVSTLSVDPYYRRLYFLEENDELYSYSLDDKTLKKHNGNGVLRMNTILHMAISVRNESIIVIGSLDQSKDNHIISTDYETSNVMVLFSGDHLSDPKGLDVFHDRIVWVNLENGRNNLYSCKLTPTCRPSDVTLHYHKYEAFHGISTYFPEKQTPSEKYLCASKQCAYGCKATSLFSAECTCPQESNSGRMADPVEE